MLIKCQREFDSETTQKQRFLANIRFIGELFKLKMLSEGIVNNCLEILLKQEINEDKLECVCTLLTSVGKELDNSNNHAKMKKYFEKLESISTKKDVISSRVRFKVLDVLDLRKNGWVTKNNHLRI